MQGLLNGTGNMHNTLRVGQYKRFLLSELLAFGRLRVGGENFMCFVNQRGVRT